MVLTTVDYLNWLLGFNIVMVHRGEHLPRGFEFSSPVPQELPVKPFLLGMDGNNCFRIRAVVNGKAFVPEGKVKRKQGVFYSGVVFNELSGVLDLYV